MRLAKIVGIYLLKYLNNLFKKIILYSLFQNFVYVKKMERTARDVKSSFKENA